jgi:hypothetical protein
LALEAGVIAVSFLPSIPGERILGPILGIIWKGIKWVYDLGIKAFRTLYDAMNNSGV